MPINNRVPNFLPSTSGLHFGNFYPRGTTYPVISLPIINVAVGAGDAGNGMCGGFSYTVMDMYLHSPPVPPPAYTDLPATNTSRFDYLVRRLFVSFGAPPSYDNAAKAIDWTQTDDRALAHAMIAGEWPAIKADIDAGRPSPLMLVMEPKAGSFLDIGTILTALKNGHQVVAWGYSLDDSGNLTLNIYDCNCPNSDDQTLKLNIVSPSQPVQITSNQSHRVRGFFRSNYRGDNPLPFMPVRGLQMDVLGHLQGIGDRHFQAEEFAGTRGQGLRLEGFQISFAPQIAGLTMRYMAHVEGSGDTPFLPEGSFVGTRGQGRRLEGFAIQLQGPSAAQYDVTYMAHLQDSGDTPFTRNGEFCGTRGQGRRLEGIQASVTRKDIEKVVALASAQFNNVFLRMDGSGVTASTASGGGKVNCQLGVGPWEKFKIIQQPDGTFAIASVAFPGVYLRMDGTGVTAGTGSGGGKVNCQFGVGPWEKFKTVVQ